MHAVYVACLAGGALATALLVSMGSVGGRFGHHAGGHTVRHVSGHRVSAGSRVGAAHPRSGGRAGSRPPGAQHALERSPLAAHLAGWTLSWLSPVALAAGALWFGGVGLLLEGDLGAVAVAPAVCAGFAGAFVMRSLMGVVVRASTPPLEATGEGILATVNATIRPDAPGEVIFSLEGLTRSSPARSFDGAIIPRGVSVAIVKRERGVAWVTPILDADLPSPPVAFDQVGVAVADRQEASGDGVQTQPSSRTSGHEQVTEQS